MERVVSLLPSATEIVCSLGFEDALLGRSHECDFPSRVACLPALTEAGIDPARPSREINDRVLELVRDGLSVYRVDAERLRELEPTLILTQDQCEVCAASLQDLEGALEQWLGQRPRVLSLSPTKLEDVWRDIGRVAEAMGDSKRGRAVTARVRERVDEIATRAASASGGEARPTVACVEWIEPLMAAGNWVPELVEMAGGRNLFGTAGEHSPWMEREALLEADPDVIVVMPCGFGIERIRAEMGALTARPGWGEMRAVREGRVYLTDGNQYFNRPGPRLVESLEILAEILQTGILPMRHEGCGWEPLGRPA